MNCDMIYVMKAGKVEEQGKFKELKKYRDLIVDEKEEP